MIFVSSTVSKGSRYYSLLVATCTEPSDADFPIDSIQLSIQRSIWTYFADLHGTESGLNTMRKQMSISYDIEQFHLKSSRTISVSQVPQPRVHLPISHDQP